MAMDELGEQFDIHGGGRDLQFPHHENEIAQSEGATGNTFANYWLHVGMLQVNNEKMAKSVGNFFTIEDVLKQHHPEAVRYFLLSSHYRSPLNYSEDNLSNAHKALTRLYQAVKGVAFDGAKIDTTWVQQYNDAMNDDFNTPEALAVLFQLSHDINKTRSPELVATLYHLAETLGILGESPEAFLRYGVEQDDKDFIEYLIAKRNEARTNKDFKTADEIRDTLLQKGIEIEDGASGTSWRKQSN
jgi:cysteinyl-tRNA synthetase